jgi:signal transduction histidine kinase
MPRVFQPFFRADRSRTRATGGLGLGLALTKRIVEAHHGMIEIESMLSEGTRAHVRLPSAPSTDT